jgi:hypothetical protein
MRREEGKSRRPDFPSAAAADRECQLRSWSAPLVYSIPGTRHLIDAILPEMVSSVARETVPHTDRR